jgi:hypothetical protein
MTRYSIIEANVQNNREEILSIIMKNLGGSLREENYVWNHNQCPYGGANHCLLAKHEQSNTFKGTAALFPRVSHMKGKSVSATIAGDIHVR